MELISSSYENCKQAVVVNSQMAVSVFTGVAPHALEEEISILLQKSTKFMCVLQNIQKANKYFVTATTLLQNSYHIFKINPH